jgi:hypothetical protein
VQTVWAIEASGDIRLLLRSEIERHSDTVHVECDGRMFLHCLPPPICQWLAESHGNPNDNGKDDCTVAGYW